MNIDFLKKNSVMLTENIDIANTDEIISAIIEQKKYSSLMYQICDVQTIHGPTGATFALVYENGKAVLKRGEVVVEDDALEDTGFTVESLQDLQRTFGKNIVDFVAKIMAGISANNENTKLINKINSWATASSNLTLSDSTNSETISFQVFQKVSELIIEINTPSFKSLDGFAILPRKAAASLLAMSNRTTDDSTNSGLFLGANGRVKFYLNPDTSSNKCYVGVNSPIPGQSSLIASPYQHSLVQATNPETGNQHIFNVNRYAITQSAMSQVEDMLFSFNIL